MLITRVLLLVAFLLPAGLAAQVESLLPVPRALQMGSGRLVVDSTFRVSLVRFRDARLERGVSRALARLEQRVAMTLPRRLTAVADSATLRIDVTGAGQRVQGVDENESYHLEVDSLGAVLRATTVVGALRGLETVLQLVTSDSTTFFLPGVTIDDAPRFRWRGLLVDVGRHFMPIDQIKRTLDGMAMVKLNVLHWHLSEDQGFRVESKRYPRLHRLGSDDQYYTQVQLREIVAYARDRGIRVVPEFDMPGHSTAWFVGYPQYSTRPGGGVTIRRDWGGADAIFDPSREETYAFIDRFIGEMAAIFPDAYWHIGGDEVEGKHWNQSRRITAWKRRRGFRNNAEAQAYFNQRMTRILTKYKKQMIGWDEILHPRLPERTVVQSWRGTNYLSEAVKAGYTSILSAPYYLDHIKPATDFYLADPVPRTTDMTPEQQALVLGGEACMWSEFVSYETTDSRLWPRLGAVAERLWSPQEITDVADMYRRLDILSGRLEASGLRVLSHSERMLRKIYPGGDLAPLDTLLTVVQPPFFGQALNGKQTNQLHPLARLVDAARPDPSGRWLTERLVRRVVQNQSDSAAHDSLVTLLTRWKNLAGPINALALETPAIGEALPVVTALERTSVIGLDALAMIRARTTPTPAWLDSAAVDFKRFEGPQRLLRVAILAEIRKLVTLLQPMVQ
jgi:hexosaminidase